MKGKRRKKEKRGKQILKVTLLLIILGILGMLLKEFWEEYKIPKQEESQQKMVEQMATNIQEPLEQEPIKVEIPKEYKGYLVNALLEIPKIKVNTCVLSEYSIKGLYECVSKFWGAEPNQIGNFCIAGHNSKRENMFSKVKELEIGDSLFISDENQGRLEYEIYDIYKVKPEDTTCLSQKTGGTRQVTLITCTNDSKFRIIVKAKEK